MANRNPHWSNQERKKFAELKRAVDPSLQVACRSGCGAYITKREFMVGNSGWHIDKSNWGGPSQPKISECIVCPLCWKEFQDVQKHLPKV